VSISDVKSVLQDGGVNIATIDFVGPTSCTVARSDVAYDQHAALEAWIDAKKGADATPATQPAPALAAAPQPAVIAAAKEEKAYHTLRELITADLAARTHLDAESLQMTFRPGDEKVLNLCEPTFRFELDPIRAQNLGDVAWTVTIDTDTGSQKVVVKANARAWQKQLVLAHPLASRQVIRDEDVVEHRALVDTLPFEPLLTKDQMTGQQASSELKPGTVMTARMVEAVPMVRAGQLVSVTLRQGSVEIRTVARAAEAGCYGQTIRLQNETTRDSFEAIVTGPQAASIDGKEAAPKVASAGQ
jgi:flagella basal body P-ring formation protein FlgA